MNPHYERALLLFHRERYEEAIGELQQHLATDGNHPITHGLLALCLNHLDRHQQALEAAQRSIEADPDCDYGYHVLARVYLERGRRAEAREAIHSALRLDPEDADNHGVLARIEFESGHWEATVEAANAGLAQDAKNDLCRHFRSLALTKLGRKDEAEQDQAALLAASPNDPYTHAARGWTLLEYGEADQAREHFLESLRLDPTNQDARSGLANALKARHFIFGVVLRSLLYLDRFRSWAVWLFIIGFFVGLRWLDRVAATHAQAVIPLFLFKAAFFTGLFLVLVAHPLFGLTLRFNREGRRALTPDQLRASNWHAVTLMAALIMGLLWAWKGDTQMRLLAMPTVLLTFAITNTFEATPGWVRQRLAGITILAAALIPLSFILFVLSIYLMVKLKLNTVWLAKLALFYLPLISVLLSAFSDNVAEFLEARRPDASAS